MAEQNLNIHVKLLDEFTSKFNKFEASLQGVGEQGLKLGRTMRQLGRDLSQIGQTVAFAGASITAPFALAFKVSEKYSLDIHRQMQRINDAMIGFQVSISEAVLPVVEKITNVLGALLEKWKQLDPVMRDHIVQGMLMSGIYLTIGGAILVLITNIVRFGGAVVAVTSKLLLFATAHPILAGIAIAIGSIVMMMGKWQDLGIPILNTIEYGIRLVAAGYMRIGQGIAYVIEMTARLTRQTKIAEYWKEQGALVEQMIQKLYAGILKIENTGKGTFVDMAEEVKRFADEMKGILSGDIKVKIKPIVEAFDAMESLARGTAQAMTNSFGQLFFNVFTGQMRNIQEVFADFGRAILQILGQVIAKFILVNTIGKIFPTPGKFFHQGGMVKAHSGYIANDEVQAVLQTGEGVLSRRGMQALGQNNLNKLNQGQGIQGGITYSPVIVIQAWDARDVQRNKGVIESVVIDALKRNSPLRSAYIQTVK